jgi:hypothetical protein
MTKFFNTRHPIWQVVETCFLRIQAGTKVGFGPLHNTYALITLINELPRGVQDLGYSCQLLFVRDHLIIFTKHSLAWVHSDDSVIGL